MAIKYELTAKSGTYMKDGQEKNSYTRCGVVLTTKDGGFIVKIEALPVNFDGWMYMNPPKNKEAPKKATKPDADSFEDDIPFYP